MPARPSRRVALIVLAVTAFLAISFALARWLTAENRERDAIVEVLRAEARGDGAAMLSRLRGCAASPACAAETAANASRLRRPGKVEVLAYASATAYSLGGATGRTRVAWHVRGGLPVVQCALVRRTGNAVTGVSITLLRLSAPIRRTGAC